VLVCSLINRPYVLDLIPGRSVVERLRAAGREVWLLDWGQPGPEDVGAGLHRYALDRLPRAIELVRKESGGRAPHLLGYCMGGTLALLALGARRIEVASLIAMATPVKLDDGGLLSLWCRAPNFDAEEVVRIYGNVPPHLLQPAFKMLDPVGLATKLYHLEDKLDDDEFVRFFLAMETWIEDSLAFPGRAFVDWVRLYREDTLAGKPFTLDGVRVDLAAIDRPILSLHAEKDYITPPASSLAIERLVPRAAHTVRRVPGGHIGLATSSLAQTTLWPEAAKWLEAHDPRPTAKPSRKPRKGR
jgi:polyhydroxyalkanoate synthase